MLIFGERQLGRVLGQYAEYFSAARRHQGLGQRIPLTMGLPVRDVPRSGLHHDYHRVVDGPPDGAIMAGRMV